MKKLLIATTALVATAGMAAADVTLSGYAEMGIKDNGEDTVFHHDLDVKFSLTGETDGGLTFGATIDLDEVANGISSENGPHSVFISGNFGTLTMGDTDGAMDWANQEIGMLTTISDDHTSHSGYWNGVMHDGTEDGQILRYDNTFGDFGVAASLELEDGGGNDNVIQLGLKYSTANVSLGLGYSDTGTSDAMSVSAKTSFSGLDIVVNYSDSQFNGSYTGLGLGYTMGDLSMTANYGDFSDFGNGYGVAANYSVGGGAVVMLGYGNSEFDDSTFSLGLGLSF